MTTWLYRRLRLAAGVGMVALAVVGCSPESDTTTDQGPGTTPVTVSTLAEQMAPAPRPSTSTASLGETEVALIVNLPVVELDWTYVDLVVPEHDGTETWLNHVGYVNGEYVAVAFAWRPPPDNQSTFTWRSADGVTWQQSELTIPQGTSMHTIVESGGAMLAIGSDTVRFGTLPRVWIANGVAGWDEVDLSTADLDLMDVHVLGAAVTETGMLLGASFDRYSSGEVVSFETRGFRFALDDFAASYEVTEITTGRLVASGRQGDLYRWDQNGQAVYNAETGALITTVPYEVWEGLYPRYSPLPVPVYTGDDWTKPHTIEWEGLEITVHEAEDLYRVTQDGVLLTEGTLQNLYRGPAPAFTDTATGEIIISFTWSEWDGLLDEAYRLYYEDSHVDHVSRQLVLFSADGSSWSHQELTDDVNTHLEWVTAIDNTFVVSLVEHADYERRTLYTSADGTQWARHDVIPGPRQINSIKPDRAGLIALSWSPEQAAVSTSEDGKVWSNSLSLATQDDGKEGWLQLVASGEMGRAATATLSQAPPFENLRISVGDRTAEFGGPGFAVRITDDATGDVLLELDWAEMEEAAARADTTFVDYDEAATRFYARNGSLVMVITDEQAYAGFEAQSRAHQAATGHVLFLEIDGSWHEASVPRTDETSALAVGPDAIVIGVTDYGPFGPGEVSRNDFGLQIGRLLQP